MSKTGAVWRVPFQRRGMEEAISQSRIVLSALPLRIHGKQNLTVFNEFMWPVKMPTWKTNQSTRSSSEVLTNSPTDVPSHSIQPQLPELRPRYSKCGQTDHEIQSQRTRRHNQCSQRDLCDHWKPRGKGNVKTRCTITLFIMRKTLFRYSHQLSSKLKSGWLLDHVPNCSRLVAASGHQDVTPQARAAQTATEWNRARIYIGMRKRV